MALTHLHSIAFIGIDAISVDVEVDVKKADKFFLILVGLPDAAVKESKDRVLTAIANSGHQIGPCHCTVNLAPGDLRKEGPLYDLPIALGLLYSSGVISQVNVSDYLFAGELGLSGQMRPMRGAISVALKARQMGKKGILLPAANASEAAAVPGISVIGIQNLREACRFLENPSCIAPAVYSSVETDEKRPHLDFAAIKGQTHAKRALEIAAAGSHNILFFGPPGSGKTMLAIALASILPPLSLDEALEVTKIHSVAGLVPEGKSLLSQRPFRSPHHTISAMGLVGGGSIPKPGEISLAHRGILFLDELPEFSRSTLEVLRQPLENRHVTISRASGKFSFPTNCICIAAMNPCPCGFLGHPKKNCQDTLFQIQRYRNKISGPFLDRIDMHVEVPALSFAEISEEQISETSADIQKRVIRARHIQTQRFGKEQTNALMTAQELPPLDPSCQLLIRQIIDKMGISARAYHRILKVARTIADLEENPHIEKHHLMEAISYRSWEKSLPS